MSKLEVEVLALLDELKSNVRTEGIYDQRAVDELVDKLGRLYSGRQQKVTKRIPLAHSS